MGERLRGRALKIIEALFAISPEGPMLVNYEDIVVRAWQLYPDDFGLRGYSDRYPDSSDIHVPLYKDLKSKGLVATGPVGQKKFMLTPAGWDVANSLFGDRVAPPVATGRMSRTSEEEIRFLERSTAVELVLAGRLDEVLDTDFFAFYRSSVRAPSREFESRLAQTRRAIDEALEKDIATAPHLREVDSFLRNKFTDIIALKSSDRSASRD
jgi:hypothetical protein